MTRQRAAKVAAPTAAVKAAPVFERLTPAETVSHRVKVGRETDLFANQVRVTDERPFRERPTKNDIYIGLIQYGLSVVDEVVFEYQNKDFTGTACVFQLPADLDSEIEKIVLEIQDGSRAKSGRLAVKKIDVILQLMEAGRLYVESGRIMQSV